MSCGLIEKVIRMKPFVIVYRQKSDSLVPMSYRKGYGTGFFYKICSVDETWSGLLFTRWKMAEGKQGKRFKGRGRPGLPAHRRQRRERIVRRREGREMLSRRMLKNEPPPDVFSLGGG